MQLTITPYPTPQSLPPFNQVFPGSQPALQNVMVNLSADIVNAICAKCYSNNVRAHFYNVMAQNNWNNQYMIDFVRQTCDFLMFRQAFPNNVHNTIDLFIQMYAANLVVSAIQANQLAANLFTHQELANAQNGAIDYANTYASMYSTATVGIANPYGAVANNNVYVSATTSTSYAPATTPGYGGNTNSKWATAAAQSSSTTPHSYNSVDYDNTNTNNNVGSWKANNTTQEVVDVAPVINPKKVETWVPIAEGVNYTFKPSKYQRHRKSYNPKRERIVAKHNSNYEILEEVIEIQPAETKGYEYYPYYEDVLRLAGQPTDRIPETVTYDITTVGRGLGNARTASDFNCSTLSIADNDARKKKIREENPDIDPFSLPCHVADYTPVRNTNQLAYWIHFDGAELNRIMVSLIEDTNTWAELHEALRASYSEDERSPSWRCWFEINRLATHTLNSYIRNEMGIEGVLIDDFYEDWPDLYAYVCDEFDDLYKNALDNSKYYRFNRLFKAGTEELYEHASVNFKHALDFERARPEDWSAQFIEKDRLTVHYGHINCLRIPFCMRDVLVSLPQLSARALLKETDPRLYEIAKRVLSFDDEKVFINMLSMGDGVVIGVTESVIEPGRIIIQRLDNKRD